MQVKIHAVEAYDIPRVDFLSQPKTYLSIRLSGVSAIQRTREYDYQTTAIWNETFYFQTPNYFNEVLSATIMSETIMNTPTAICRVDIPLKQLQVGQIYNHSYEAQSIVQSQKRCFIRLIIQVAPIGNAPMNNFSANQYPGNGGYGQNYSMQQTFMPLSANSPY